MVLKRLLAKLVKTCWLIVAMSIVLIAMLLSAVRIALPHADGFKDNLSEWIAEEAGQPIEFGKIDADWQGLGPALVLSGVRFNSISETAPLLLNIKSVNVQVDFWRSVMEQRLVARNFVLDGVDLLVNPRLMRESDGSNSDDGLIELLSELFLKHFQRFEVINSKLQVITPAGVIKQLDINQLSWINLAGRHQGVGLFALQGLNDKFKFVLDLYDDIEGEGLNGQLYFQSNRLNVSAWLSNFINEQIEQVDTSINLKGWLTINKGQFVKFDSLLEQSELSWQQEQTRHSLVLDDIRLSAKLSPVVDQWEIQQLNMQLDGQDYISDSIRGTTIAGQSQIQVEDLPLAPIVKLATLFELPDEVNQLLLASADNMTLQRLDINKNRDSQWQILAKVDELGWQAVSGLPGINHWQATVATDLNRLSTQLTSHSSQLIWPGMFENMFELERAEALISTRFDRDFALDIKQLNLTLPQTEIQAQAKLISEKDKPLQLFAFAETKPLQVSDVSLFLPKEEMGVETYEYLLGSLKGGHAEYAQVLWHGSFAEYPFAEQEGVFHARVVMEQGEFKFQPDWPAVTELALQLDFINEGLFFASEQGKLLDVELLDLDASIADLIGVSNLELTAKVKASGQAATAVMNGGSLQDSVGQALNEIQISGDLSGELHLHLNLDTSDDLHVKGKVTFADNPVLIAPTNFAFNQVNGVLEFDMDKIRANDLTFNWGPVPYQINLFGEDTESAYQVSVDLANHWQPSQFLPQMQFANIAEYLDGGFDWQGKLDLSFPKDGFSYEFSLGSDLAGLQVDLPQPFDKSAQQPRAFVLTGSGDLDASVFHAHFGSELNFDAHLPHDTSVFDRVLLTLGEPELTRPAQGFNVVANLEQAVLDDYVKLVLALMADVNAQPSSDKPVIIGKPERIKGQIDKLALGPFDWHKVIVDSKNLDSNWLADVTANEFRGQLNLNEDWHGKGIKIDADYWLIQARENKNETSLETKQQQQITQNIYDNTPPVSLSCKKCEWGKLPLGKVTASLKRQQQALLLESFDLDYKEHKLSGTGNWIYADGISTTQFAGNLNTDDMGHWLREYDLTSAIRDSSATADFVLTWQKAPFLFDKSSLAGDVKWRLGEGYLTEVSDKGARIFSVLSFDSLIRKLRLDFRDVFSKGLFFNSMEGNLQIDNGIASTDDTVMDGVAGNMEIKGVTDLNTEQIDYQIAFVPKVTSSLPVLVAWMVNPVTGVAALALDQVLESAEVVSKIQFELGGTIDKPEIIETKRSSREVQIGNQNKPKVPQPKTSEQSPVQTLPQPNNMTVPSTEPQFPNDGGV